MGELNYIWYSEEGPGRAAALPSSLLAVPNVTAHQSTASVPIIVLLYGGPLLCGINVAIKGLRSNRVLEITRSRSYVFSNKVCGPIHTSHGRRHPRDSSCAFLAVVVCSAAFADSAL